MSASVSWDSFFFSEQKFGSLRSDVIEQMRFKQRLKVIQSLEDTAKRSVVRPVSMQKEFANMLMQMECLYICVCPGEGDDDGVSIQYRRARGPLLSL